MDVVLDSADDEKRAIKLFGDGTEARVKRLAPELVAQERPALFGEKTKWM